MYRSGPLHALTEGDVARLRAMGVRVAFDLRSVTRSRRPSRSRQRSSGTRASRSRGTDASRSGFSDGATYLRARYDEILFELGDHLGSVLVAIAHDDCLPAVIHCAVGKDRTGVVAAVLLLALGVDVSTVLHDYELTSQCEAAQRVEELATKLGATGLPPALVAGLLGTHRSALAGAIEELGRRFGTIDAYLRDAAGLVPDDLDALRSRLTVPAPTGGPSRSSCRSRCRG